MNYAIVTKDLCKKYKKVNALDNVSVNIERGNIYGVIGKNGAGKTTLLKLLSGMIYSTSGEIRIDYKVNSLIGALIEEPGLFYDMTALENLRVKAYALGLKDDGELNTILDKVGLVNCSHIKVKNYSLGMKQRLGIALALVGDPEIIILDEPINGLDPQGIAEIRKLILTLKEKHKKTIIVSSHILEELFKIGDKYAIINQGKLVLEATKDELQKRMEKKMYICSSNILELEKLIKKLQITKYHIKSDKIVIYDNQIESWELMKQIVENDIRVTEIKYQDVSYEEFFLQLIGGKDNAFD